MVVLFPGALGDLCLLAPALAALAADGVDLALSVQRKLQPVAAMLLPTVEIGPAMDGALVGSLFAEVPAPELISRMQRADQVHAWLARGDPDGAVRVRLHALGLAVAWHAVPRHEAERHVGEDYAAALGCRSPLRAPRASAPASAPIFAWCAPTPRRVLLHPGSGGAHKRWDSRGFRAVADAVRAAGREVVVLLGPAEEDEAVGWKADGLSVVDGLGLPEAATVIASAPTWIGNDSGMSHLAGALGRRGVVLFGPTTPARWRPRGGRLVPVEIGGRVRADVVRDVAAIVLADEPTVA